MDVVGRLTSNTFEHDRLVGNPKLLETMRAAARHFAKPQAARLIAEELINIALSHEK